MVVVSVVLVVVGAGAGAVVAAVVVAVAAAAGVAVVVAAAGEALRFRLLDLGVFESLEACRGVMSFRQRGIQGQSEALPQNDEFTSNVASNT